jgi:cytochrome c551/c552
MKKTLLISAFLASFAVAEIPQVLTDNGCLSCHGVSGVPKSAPSFRGIARKNTKWFGESAKAKIMASIAQGSQGKYPRFSSAKMPPYTALSQAQLDEIATWILSNGQGGNGMRRGMGNGMNQGNRGGM